MATTQPAIVGIAEIAEMAGIPRSTVRSLGTRGQLPEPQVVLACGPIWKRSVIERWIKRREKER